MKRPVKRHEVHQPLDKPFRYIPLTQGLNATVDVADYKWLSKWNWYAQWDAPAKTFYATRRDGERRVAMHRLIVGECRPEIKVDHRNFDTLDNRRQNLRPATRAQNVHHQRKRRDNTSGFKGVYWEKDRGAWCSQIRINNTIRRLGRFRSAKEAALAYDAVAREHYGDFATLNFQDRS